MDKGQTINPTFCKRGHLRISVNLYKNRWCKLCCKERDKTPEQKQRQAKNSRKNNLKQWYGLSLEQYNDMFLKQNGLCAICKIHQNNLHRTFNIDHNHQTGKVRGLLCSTCNSGMGSLKDNITLLEAAIQYLKDTN